MGLLMVGFGAMPALAIPEAEAIKKLEAVAVYVVVAGNGNPDFSEYRPAWQDWGLPILPTGDSSSVTSFFQQPPNQLVLRMYMKAEEARQVQEELEKRSGVEGSEVVPIALNIAFENNKKLLEEIRSRDKDRELITLLVPARADWEKAEEILLAQGIDQEEIDRNLKVPVFFTNPPISITPPGEEEAKIAFFFNHSQLEQAKQAMADFEGEDKVVDLRQAINLVVQEEEDKYFFLPTEDLIKTIQDYQQQSEPSATQPEQPEQEQESGQ